MNHVLCVCISGAIPQRLNIKRQKQCCFRFKVRWKGMHDVPFKPTNVAGLYKHLNFLVFTNISLCNKASSQSCLLWHHPRRFRRVLDRRFHALFSVFPFPPLRTKRHCLRILSFFIFNCLCILLTFAQINLSCSYFCQSLPSSLHSLSCCSSL